MGTHTETQLGLHIPRPSPTDPDHASAQSRRAFTALLGAFGAMAVTACADGTSRRSEADDLQRDELKELEQALGTAATLYVAATAADLRAVDLAGANAAWLAVLEGVTSAVDGGWGVFYWSAAAALDNTGTVINQQLANGAINPMAASGWRRLFSGPVNARWFAGPAHAAITSALSVAAAVGENVYCPSGTYSIGASLAVPPNVGIVGDGLGTVFLLDFDGDMISLADGSRLEGLTLSGQGNAVNPQNVIKYPNGRGIVIGVVPPPPAQPPATQPGNQRLRDVRVRDFNSTCLAFTHVAAGSQFHADSCELYQYFATGAEPTGSGRYAIKIEDVFQEAAVVRSFVNVMTGGRPSFSFGGANDLFIVNSFLADLSYSFNTKSVHIGQSRIAKAPVLTLRGNQNTIVGCDVFSQIVLESDLTQHPPIYTDACAVSGNSYNSLPIVDNSKNPRNLIDHAGVTFAPILGGSGNSIGNGSITGTYSRSGANAVVSVNIQLGPSSTISFAGLQVTLPFQRGSSNVVSVGSADYYDASSNKAYSGIAKMPGSAGFLYLYAPNGGANGELQLVTTTIPFLWASGDTISFTVTIPN